MKQKIKNVMNKIYNNPQASSEYLIKNPGHRYTNLTLTPSVCDSKEYIRYKKGKNF